MNSASTDVLISEVGPRDGLQSIKSIMPTAQKNAWIDALYRAGIREIEVASFVPAKLLPQMADAAQVVQHAVTHARVGIMALVPNRHGAEAALRAGFAHLKVEPLRGNVGSRFGDGHQPAQAQTRYAGRTWVPVAEPPTDLQLEALGAVGPVVLLALVGRGTPKTGFPPFRGVPRPSGASRTSEAP